MPTSKRAGAIVYGGTADLGLWRPPGPDRTLISAYGDDLQRVLDDARTRLPEGRLALHGSLRVNPGKLRCDFMIWVADRQAHAQLEPASAPDAETVKGAARAAIEYAASRDVTRLAFGALGDGPGALEAHERMAAVVAAASEHEASCRSEGRGTGMEEIIICHPSVASVTKAKRLVGKAARQAAAPPPRAAPSEPAPRRASRATGAARKPRKAALALDPDKLMMAKGSAHPYDRSRSYMPGEWLVHPRFGAGQVQLVHAELMVTVLFEDGQQRRMVHAR